MPTYLLLVFLFSWHSLFHPTIQAPEPSNPDTVKWCAVGDEFADCQYHTSLLGQTDLYLWKCVRRETIQECLESIKTGEADLIDLEPGLAYTAFLNYSMKAIANEFYMNQTESYASVAIVNREACEGGKVSLSDFKGRRSCHGGYLTAVGWNYPVKYISSFYQSRHMNDGEIITDFFSAVCAPSDFNGMGLCHGCANKNNSCFSNGPYSGNSGAFRCLVEHAGDIAFVKDDTPILYAKEGPYNQIWSTKLANEFMYLCPKGGCREINGYPGDCILGTVPANVIMARNSISNKKKSIILNTLLNASWADALYSGKNSQGHLLSSSTQGLAEIKQLTRSYLGLSAPISKTIQQWNDDKVKIAASNTKSVPDASYAKLLNLPSPCLLAMSWIITMQLKYIM